MEQLEAALFQGFIVSLQFGEERKTEEKQEAREDPDTKLVTFCGVEPVSAVEQGAGMQKDCEYVEWCRAERESGLEAMRERRLDDDQTRGERQ